MKIKTNKKNARFLSNQSARNNALHLKLARQHETTNNNNNHGAFINTGC